MIFVSIASYRDDELIQTIESCINNADHPKNLKIVVVQQCLKREKPDLSVYPQVQEIWLRPQDAKGAGYARNLAQTLYDGEDYFLQIDSHTRFEKSWDTELISILKNSADIAGTPKIILSQFPKPFGKEGAVDIDINDPRYPKEPHKQTILWAKKQVFTAQRVPLTSDQPEESHTILAGFMFAPGYLVEEVPYDPDISFFGEELCFAIRAWTRGWKIYSPNKMLVAHYYKRPQTHKIWDSGNNVNKKWGKLERVSMLKQADIYRGVDLGIWGAADKESLQQYKDFIGLDITKIYDDMLADRGLMAKTLLEAEVDINGFGPALSIPCMDGSHNCEVVGCECQCH